MVRFLAEAEPGDVLVVFDLDHFKRVNDDFGHLVGDEALRQVVAQITAQLRGTDELGRYGGEEFLLLLGAPSDDAQARAAVERMLRSVQEHDWSSVAPGLGVTTSAGVAVARPDETVLQMINRADNALYRAKNAGRNRVSMG
jgi:diguanylate cyclase (GGDEF)-like protein